MAARSPLLSPSSATYRAVLDAGYLDSASPNFTTNTNTYANQRYEPHAPNQDSIPRSASANHHNHHEYFGRARAHSRTAPEDTEPEVRFDESQQGAADDPAYLAKSLPPTQREPSIAQPRAISLRRPEILRPSSAGTGAATGTGTGSAAGVNGGPGKFTEDWDAEQRGTSILADYPSRRSSMHRSHSFASGVPDEAVLLNRGNTLRKKASLRRSGSLGRSSSRRSMKAGSVRSLALQSTTDPDEAHSALYCPIPTSGNPTEALAGRFQSWRKILKELIVYFKEVQSHYEQRYKSAAKLASASQNVPRHPGFLDSGGLGDAMEILRGHNKAAAQDAVKAQEIEADVVAALAGLRSDLQHKIKEIRNLSGDFKNNVDKEMDGTRKAVKALQAVLGQAELDTALTTGKQDPYLLRLAADRQVERQIDEENYLHQAYLNLEASGRELESIVVGEIQKAYNAYASILRREADTAYTAIEELRVGPIDMPKDHEWNQFMSQNDHFVDPAMPVRSTENIHYPGRDHMACQEIRAGLLERKSKYLKSYTAGWYVLSPTHLHEFKSADKAQAPVMSLYLPEQKLGSHSAAGTSSQKFILKGRQTGSMHRGHTWVFRAESHDTMMAWYEDIRALTGGSAKERTELVMRGGGSTMTRAGRSNSQASRRSTSSDGRVVDEEDEEPFSAGSQVDVNAAATRLDEQARRPEPGGRFPSDIHLNAQRGMQASTSPSTVSSGLHDRNIGGAVGGLGPREERDLQDGAARGYRADGYGTTASQTRIDEAPSHAAMVSQEARRDGVNPYTSEPLGQDVTASYGNLPMNAAMGGFEHRPQVKTPDYVSPVDTQGESTARPPYTPQGLEVDSRDISGGAPQVDDAVRDGPGVGVVGDVPNGSVPEREVPAEPTRTDLDRQTTLANLHVPGMYPKSTPNLNQASGGATG